MILKKPYAFLIKNFRIIHLVLTFLIGFLLTKSFSIYSFLSRYVNNIYSTLGDASPSNYITTFMFVTCVLIVASALSMYLLMRKKEKPIILYVALSIYYLIFLVLLIVYYAVLKNTEGISMSIRDAMVYRDIMLIAILPQFVFAVVSFIRGVGFDIKKFNFSKDLKELDISDEDSEEFEFVLGVDSYKYKRFINRRIREFKYYVLENKFMFTILSGLTVVVFLIVTALNIGVYHRVYGKSQRVNVNNLSVQVNNSYLTNMSYTGEKIVDGKYFLVINTTFTNKSGNSTVLNLSSYELKTKHGNVTPTLSRNNYFADLGAGYQKEKIEPNTTVTYILVYELDEKDKANKYTLHIIDSVNYKVGTINTKYKDIAIKPRVYDKIDKVGTYYSGDNITMYDSLLNNSSLQVNSYSFTSKYTYKYEACIRTSCSNKTDVVVADAAKNKVLLVLNGKLVVDKTSTFATNLKTSLSFFDAFVKIRYDNKIANVTNKTLASLTESYVLEVDSAAKNAKNVDLVITIRNKEYTLKLK